MFKGQSTDLFSFQSIRTPLFEHSDVTSNTPLFAPDQAIPVSEPLLEESSILMTLLENDETPTFLPSDSD